MEQDSQPLNVGSMDGLGLLPERALQARTMTLSAGPRVTPFEAGHWYSPTAVRELLEPELNSRGMFVARLRRLQSDGVNALTVDSVLALLDDCDMLAQRPNDSK